MKTVADAGTRHSNVGGTVTDLIWSCPDCLADLDEWWCPACETLWAPPAVAAGTDPPDWSDDE